MSMGAHVRKDDADRFYTIPSIAKSLVGKLDISKYKLVIEPSAGNGSFSSLIPGCLAFDVYPCHPSVIEQDFLLWEYDGKIDRSDILCIGNPPYGVNCSLAVKFVKKACSIADTVAFILPRSFMKLSRHKHFPLTFHLVEEIDIGSNNATLHGQICDIPVIFQIWVNKYHNRVVPVKTQPFCFEYVDRSRADFCVRRVGVYAGTAYKNLSKSETAHYYIKTAVDSDLLVSRINKIKWPQNNTTGQRSISKDELNIEINNIIKSINV